MNENMSSLERIDVCYQMLDHIVEAQGRAKAGYVMIIDDMLQKIQEDILIKEEQLKDLQSNQNGTEDSEPLSPE